MFKYTSTNVINTTKDSSGKELFSGSTDSFNVKRVNNFKAKNIAAIYHSPYVAPRLAKAALDLGSDLLKDPKTNEKPQKGEHFRLSIYIRLDQSSQVSYYSNDMVFKGKPLSVEFVWQDGAENTASYLANIIKKYEVAVYEKPIVKVSAEGSILTIDATDQYQRFYTVELEKYDAEAYHGMGEYIPMLKALPTKVGDGKGNYVDNNTTLNPDFTLDATIEQGYEGFGTYEYILHNLRLPTPARTRYLAQNQDESPIVGAHYDEFVIKYCVNRGIMGNNAVGDMVTSMTTHVFYVNHTVLDSFKQALDKLELDFEIEDVMPEYVLQVLSEQDNKKPDDTEDDFDSEEKDHE